MKITQHELFSSVTLCCDVSQLNRTTLHYQLMNKTWMLVDKRQQITLSISKAQAAVWLAGRVSVLKSQLATGGLV